MPTNSELWSVGMSLGNKIEKPKMDLSCSSFMFCSSWSCTPSIVRDWYVNLVAKIGSLAATQKNLTPQLIVNPIVNLDLAFHRASCSIHYGFVSLGMGALDMGLSLYQLKFHKSLYLVPDLDFLLTLVYSVPFRWNLINMLQFSCISMYFKLERSSDRACSGVSDGTLRSRLLPYILVWRWCLRRKNLVFDDG